MTVITQKETLGFQTEVTQLLHLLAHSLYSNEEVFLRELIANASDAADKLRFESLTDKQLLEDDGSELKIWIDIDKVKQTITLRDNGIGMSRQEVIENLGTIAKSGTKEFLKQMTADKAKASNLIGQFGVGFYSAFVVADKVTVLTRRAGLNHDEGVYWESTGEGEYNIQTINKPLRGTEIILHLKKDKKEFLEDYRLRNIITKYSDHIILPIVMQVEEEVEIEADEKETGKKEEEGENKKPKTQKILKQEIVNKASALWTLPKSNITEEQYTELYKHISHDFEGPLVWAHNKVEGKLEYISLLYIPSRAPFDLMNRDRKQGIKLYVQRVFIMDDAEQLMPSYLRFVKGIIDSSDLPLNVSRELLQNSKVIESMRTASIKRVLEMLEKLGTEDKEKYASFWKQFGAVMKEGPAEDFANKELIAKLLRFASTHNNNEVQDVSFEDYIGRMKEGQDKIYYITAETFAAAKNSPHLEIFRKKGIEVLLFSERVDEWLVSHLTEFTGKPLQSVAKGDLDFAGLEDEQEKEKQKEATTEFESVIKQMQEVLGEKVKEVKLTHRLTDSPACLVADQYGMSINLQRMLKEAGQGMPASKPTLELNPEHPLVLKLKQEQNEALFAEWTQVLFDQSLLAEGGQLEDPASFVKRLNGLLLQLAD